MSILSYLFCFLLAVFAAVSVASKTKTEPAPAKNKIQVGGATCNLRSILGTENAEEMRQLHLKSQDPKVLQGAMNKFGVKSLFRNRGFADKGNTGDFARIVDRNDGTFMIFFGDGKGHDMNACKDSLALHDLFDLRERSLVRSNDPAAALIQLDTLSDRFIAEKKEEGTFSLMAVHFNPKTWTVTVANAAMPTPYIIRKSNGKDGIVPLVSEGPMLGIDMYSTLKGDVASAQLNRGDMLILLSDGITESGQQAKFDIESLLRKANIRANTPSSFANILMHHPELPSAHDDRSLLIVMRP